MRLHSSIMVPQHHIAPPIIIITYLTWSGHALSLLQQHDCSRQLLQACLAANNNNNNLTLLSSLATGYSHITAQHHHPFKSLSHHHHRLHYHHLQLFGTIRFSSLSTPMRAHCHIPSSSTTTSHHHHRPPPITGTLAPITTLPVTTQPPPRRHHHVTVVTCRVIRFHIATGAIALITAALLSASLQLSRARRHIRAARRTANLPLPH